MPKGSMQGRIQVVEQSRCRTHRQQTTTIAQMQSQQSIHSPSSWGRGLGIGIEIENFLYLLNLIFLEFSAELRVLPMRYIYLTIFYDINQDFISSPKKRTAFSLQILIASSVGMPFISASFSAVLCVIELSQRLPLYGTGAI